PPLSAPGLDRTRNRYALAQACLEGAAAANSALHVPGQPAGAKLLRKAWISSRGGQRRGGERREMFRHGLRMATLEQYLPGPARWPAMPVPHRAYLEAAIPKLRADDRLVGLAAGGSFISRMLDEHSDLDLVVVSRPDAASAVLRDGPDLARK